MAGLENDQLYGVVDMGSNGIRLSISTLEQPTTRSLPTLYQSRLGISLYDAQFENGKKIPIPEDTITTIISALKRFKQTCLDFDVPQRPENVRILATEATRTATNGAEFISAIETALGEPWRVNMLKKEDEGRIGALGVVSSVGGSAGVEGLMMDLGGGSTQITWIIARPGQDLQTSTQGSISFPYGAAAMTQLLSDIDNNPKTDPENARNELRTRMISQFQEALETLALPPDLKLNNRRLTLYLSGGGFRGWGYLLMSAHRIRPYPIPIINGFCASVKDFKNTSLVSELAAKTLDPDVNTSANTKDNIAVFRVSKRRATQVPAVSFLVDALMEAIPNIYQIRFCQGGVREGWLFDQLPKELRAVDPLVAASGKYATDLSSARHFAEVLTGAIPPDSALLDRSVPASIQDQNLIRGFANLIFLQQGNSKETAAVNALQVPVTGLLANAYGVGHQERALLALALCQRWGDEDDLPAPYGELKGRLELLLTQQEVWWARYLGTLGACIGEIYPAGRLKPGTGQERIGFSSRWSHEGLDKKGLIQGVIIKMSVMRTEVNGADMLSTDAIQKIVGMIEDRGKKKNRVGGKEYGFGLPLRIDVEG